MPEIASQHFDIMDLPIETKFVKDDAGVLRGRAAVTNVGVFSYRQKDGSIVRQARKEEDVFDKDSLASLRNVWVTNEHPPILVNPNNADKYAVGKTDDAVTTAGPRVSVGVEIDDPVAVATAEAGRRSFSCGYECDYEFKSGTYLGMDYDVVQKNIRYNHVAMCDAGRAGETARMLLDSMDADASFNTSLEEHTVPKEYRAITIDGANYDAEERVVQELAKVRSDLAASQALVAALTQEKKTQGDAFATEKSTLLAERDDAKSKVEKLTKDVADLTAKVVDETEMKKRVDAALAQKAQRDSLVAFAKSLKLDVADTASDIDVMKAVIVKARPGTNMDSADEPYVRARFACVKEDAEAAAKAAGDSRLGAGFSGARTDSAAPCGPADLATAHDKMKEKVLKGSIKAPAGTKEGK